MFQLFFNKKKNYSYKKGNLPFFYILYIKSYMLKKNIKLCSYFSKEK